MADGTPSPANPWWLPRLTVDLGSLVGSNRVDVPVLDRAPATLALAVVREGLVVFERRPGEADDAWMRHVTVDTLLRALGLDIREFLSVDEGDRLPSPDNDVD